MHETEADLQSLQSLLDRSHDGAGHHLRSILRDDRRLDAGRLAELLPGVQILTLATVTSDGRPITGPVDGLFFRGHFYFGSSPDSVRFRHLRSRPHVSATHVRGEEMVVVVHGTAHEVSTAAPDQAGFRSYLIEVYGDAWEEWGPDAPYARIDAQKMFAAWLPTVELDT